MLVISKFNKIYLGYVDAVNDILDDVIYTFWCELADVSARTMTLAQCFFVVVILQRKCFWGQGIQNRIDVILKRKS